VRSYEALILALRGEGSRARPWLDWLESTARESEDVQAGPVGLGAAALVRAALGDKASALKLLGEREAFEGADSASIDADVLPMYVRAAIALGDVALAERLVAGYDPRNPYTELAVAAAKAALAEARGDLATALAAYLEAAERWERFGVVPETAFALLGQGRCLLALDRPTEAALALRRAREIFGQLGAAPALAETEALLGDAG